MIYPRHCPECGKEVRPLPDKETEIIVPTCTGCGEQFIDEKIAEEMDQWMIKNKAIERIEEVAAKLQDYWPNDNIPLSKGKKYSKELTRTVTALKKAL